RWEAGHEAVEQGAYGVRVSSVCRRVKMSRQNYYARRRQRERRRVDGDLVAELVRQERQLQPRVGTRKLQVLLQGNLAQAGVKLGRDRMLEELRLRDLLVKPRAREYPRTTCSRHGLPVYPNLIKEREVSGPNEVWVGDLTYLRTREGFMYLSLLTDKASRKIVGYHCAESLETEGCLEALEMALKDLPAGRQPIHHSDRGAQYCSHAYVSRVQARGLTVSMTEKHHTAENALAERVNGILKSEYALGLQFASKEQARRGVSEAVHWYNTRRPHTALGYRIPAVVHSLSA
ncbi:MAG TPA: IS3 family transposase, partial [Verrucomicrobiae bacterium]|nr:IS3 family transposase [Verrucomicrobiae bacterium]